MDHTSDQTGLTAQQSVYAVLSIDNFMLLRTENDYNVSVLQQLETAARLTSQQVTVLTVLIIISII